VTWRNEVIVPELSALQKQSFPTLLVSQHIYLKEMWAVYKCIQQIGEAHSRTHIVIAVDNTAVTWALRNRFSHNKRANEMIQRIEHILGTTNCSLQIVSVPSALNAADAPGRGMAYDNKIDEQCRMTIAQALLGLGKVGPASEENLQ